MQFRILNRECSFCCEDMEKTMVHFKKVILYVIIQIISFKKKQA